MKTLQQIKDDYAKERGCKDWWEFARRWDISVPASIYDEIAKRYAAACCKATLEKAAENATVDLPSHRHLHGTKNIYKPSITDPSNIVLL